MLFAHQRVQTMPARTIVLAAPVRTAIGTFDDADGSSLALEHLS